MSKKTVLSLVPAFNISILPVIVASWPAPANVNSWPDSKTWDVLNVRLPAPLVALLAVTIGLDKAALIPIPLTVLTLGNMPFTEETASVVLLQAAVDVVVIGANVILRSVSRNSKPDKFLIFSWP